MYFMVLFPYFYSFQDAVIKVWKARVLVHHAVDELCELQKEGLTRGEAIASQALDQLDNMGHHLRHRTTLRSAYQSGMFIHHISISTLTKDNWVY